MFVRYECCVLSGRSLCDALITRPEESYRLWCVVVCDLETSRTRRPWTALGRSAMRGGLKFIQPQCPNFVIYQWIKAYCHLNNAIIWNCIINICTFTCLSCRQKWRKTKEQCLLQLSCDHRIVSGKCRFTCCIAPEEVKVHCFLCNLYWEMSRDIAY